MPYLVEPSQSPVRWMDDCHSIDEKAELREIHWFTHSQVANKLLFPPSQVPRLLFTEKEALTRRADWTLLWGTHLCIAWHHFTTQTQASASGMVDAVTPLPPSAAKWGAFHDSASVWDVILHVSVIFIVHPLPGFKQYRDIALSTNHCEENPLWIKKVESLCHLSPGMH